MKMFKRIFIALLIVSVFISSMAATAFAAETGEDSTDTDVETEPKYSMTEYENMLEYFEEECLFDYDFTGDGVDYSASLLANSTGERADRIVVEQAGGALSVCIKGREENARKYAYDDLHAYLSWTSDAPVGSFNIDMELSGSSNPGEEYDKNNLPKIVVVVSDSKLESVSGAATGTAIASVDFRGGYLTYLKAVDNGEGEVKGAEFVTDFAISADSWYAVSITYDVKAGRVSITVTDSSNADNSITVTDGYIPYATVSDIRVGAHGTDAGTSRGTVMSFAAAKVYGGVYHRDLGNMQADVEEKLLLMYETVCDVDTLHDDRFAICNIVEKIKNYGFTTESADVQAVLDELGIGGAEFYNNKLADCISNVDGLATYAEKREYADDALDYSAALDGFDLSEETDEMLASIEANILALNEIDEHLKYVESQALDFIAAVDEARKIDINSYPDVSAQVELLGTYYVDTTYENAEEAYYFYIHLCDTKKSIEDGAELFISEVAKAADEETDINDRVAAFRILLANFFGNETYPGVTEALDTYWGFYSYLSDVIYYSESYIRYVEKADYSPYVLAKQSNLDAAKDYLEGAHPDYNGVAEAKVLYVEVQKNIDSQIANANKYIAAVNALDKVSIEELVTAIEAAKELKKTGNVDGVPGVIEANIKLDEIIASIELGERYCNYFIRLVNSLDDATSVSQYYKILVAATKAQADVDDSYEGITEACEKLEKAIDDYNNKVINVNVEFEHASRVSATFAGAGKGTNYVSVHVIALIKKVFGEE